MNQWRAYARIHGSVIRGGNEEVQLLHRATLRALGTGRC
ncbi:hypothetical protein Mycsm_07082 (plasmid) [Mycobacterium sp. JS623]|nr:hypothetical protein Mycsm_07082 [Mycobacterium sp. JS623]